MKKNLVLGLILTLGLTMVGCTNNNKLTEVDTSNIETVDKAVDEAKKETEEPSNAEAEEYNPHKEYNSGDIVTIKGEVLSITHEHLLISKYANVEILLAPNYTQKELEEEYNLENGGEVEVTVKFITTTIGGIKSVKLLDLEVIETYPFTLGDYCELRASFEVNVSGISKEEALILYSYCQDYPYAKQFEESLGDESIFALYPELTTDR